MYERPIAERHRLVFYRGHLEAFDWNLLREPLLRARAFAPTLDRLFAFGIDPVGGALPSDEPRDWPALDHVERYVRRVRDTIDGALERIAPRLEHASDGDDAPGELLNMAIEHRLMHAETLAYLLHRLPYDRKRGRARSDVPAPPVRDAAMVDVPAGTATMGRVRGAGFGWDNEFDAQRVDVPAFSIDRYKVTNGEFLRFVDAGGYAERAHWSAADWQWKTDHGIAHPAFWRRASGRWRWRGMFDERDLPLAWPVYVSHAEASAYASWAGKRLPSEAQWHRAASGLADSGDARDGARSNFDLGRWDPIAVHAQQQRSAFGVVGLRGNGWEWTSTVFAPFGGFRSSPHYRGYSADFFDGRHFVLKGASPRTAACIARLSFRNWFQPHYPHVYAAFRCVSR